ncbi:MAG: SDR family oxidoreductase [Lachnospiraceae bacterium]|nr:SDR family oxidoreductase [Lachnospiraceae bacterium]
MFDLKNKKVLVTGSTQGIGLALAKGFAEQGAVVFINGASGYEKCKKAAEEVPNSRIAFCSLSDAGCAEKLYEITGDIDILILNASIQYRKAWDEITSEEFDAQIKVNFKSSLELIQKYAPYMKEQGWGRILTIGSVQQYKPHKDMIVYAASKCAQMSMVENLAKQLAPFGITVNNLAPGVIETPRNTDALADKAYKEKVMAGIPCGYAGEPKDCVAGALLLCSEEGRYINGVDLVIDGGMKL